MNKEKMMKMHYELELEKVKNEVKKSDPNKVLIQLPEGLKDESKRIIDKVKSVKEKLDVTLDGEIVHGACCIPEEPEREKYDLVIHFGHTEMVPADNVIYVPVKSKEEVKNVAEKAAERSKGEKIGLTTTTQHLHKLEEMKKGIEKAGKEPVTREGDQFIKEAQVLGCCFISATEIRDEVDSFIFIGSGKFHALGVANSTDLRVIQGNPYKNEVNEIEPGKWKREKEMRKDKARDPESFAIIETPYPGQTSHKVTEQVNEKLEKNGKDTYKVKLSQITPNRINHLPFDAFVINACPRIVRDDWSNYDKPILLPKEAEELVKS